MSSYKVSITDEEIKNLPLKQFDGEICIINSPIELDKALDFIGQQKITGFDTETKPAFKKHVKNKVSLVQIATAYKVYIIRIKNTGITHKLKSFFENENIIKAGVALKDDLKSLQKIKNFNPVGFVDLQGYVKNYGIENNGLKKITAIVLGFRISKSQQTSNWDSEILTESQIRYASTDAWVCYEIYIKLNQQ